MLTGEMSNWRDADRNKSGSLKGYVLLGDVNRWLDILVEDSNNIGMEAQRFPGVTRTGLTPTGARIQYGSGRETDTNDHLD